MHGTNRPPPAASSVADYDDAPSLWRELADGTASTGVKVFVCVALAPLLAGVALLFSYLLALAGWGSRYALPGYTVPSDEIIAILTVLAGLLYLGAVAWLWTRNRAKDRPLWGAALLTLGIAAVTTLACVLAEDSLYGTSEEVVIGGLVCLAVGTAVLIWVHAARRYQRGVPMRDRRDGALDVRCPSCGYRMVGLHESRCPECGTSYTLDELLARQHFLTRADRNGSQAAAAADLGAVAHPTAPASIPPPPPAFVYATARDPAPLARTPGQSDAR